MSVSFLHFLSFSVLHSRSHTLNRRFDFSFFFCLHSASKETKKKTQRKSVHKSWAWNFSYESVIRMKWSSREKSRHSATAKEEKKTRISEHKKHYIVFVATIKSWKYKIAMKHMQSALCTPRTSLFIYAFLFYILLFAAIHKRRKNVHFRCILCKSLVDYLTMRQSIVGLNEVLSSINNSPTIFWCITRASIFFFFFTMANRGHSDIISRAHQESSRNHLKICW